MRRSSYPLLCVASSLAASLLALPANALDDDWQQPMTILSDSAELDRRAGTVIYEGNVTLTQGTLLIEADRLMVLRNGEVLEKAVAEGNPARYQQQIDTDESLTNAHGNRIDYYTGEQRITLRGDAELRQDGNLFSGEQITYDMKTETVKASGQSSDNSNTAVGEAQPDGRIKVIIQPPKPAEAP